MKPARSSGSISSNYLKLNGSRQNLSSHEWWWFMGSLMFLKRAYINKQPCLIRIWLCERASNWSRPTKAFNFLAIQASTSEDGFSASNSLTWEQINNLVLEICFKIFQFTCIVFILIIFFSRRQFWRRKVGWLVGLGRGAGSVYWSQNCGTTKGQRWADRGAREPKCKWKYHSLVVKV